MSGRWIAPLRLHTPPFGLSLSKPASPFGLSLSKPTVRTRRFDKLSANGGVGPRFDKLSANGGAELRLNELSANGARQGGHA
jgi:hypothetical protein